MTKEVFVWRELECRDAFEYMTKEDITQYLTRLTEVPPDARLDIGTYDNYGDTSAYVKWTWKEPESAEEKAARGAREKAQKEYRRKQYEALAKEFSK